MRQSRELSGTSAKSTTLLFRLYGIEGEDRRAIEEVVSGQLAMVGGGEGETDDAEEETEAEAAADARNLVADLLSYTLGCAFGRWDIRFAMANCLCLNFLTLLRRFLLNLLECWCPHSSRVTIH